MKKHFSALFFFLLFINGFINSGSINSQVSEVWSSRYNGLSDSMDVAKAVVTDNSGNVYITGYSWGLSTLSDYVTIKYSSSGTQLWSARYNGPASMFDEANAIALDDSGNVYVTGYSTGILTYKDYATVKYNNAGVFQWVKRYDGGLSDDEASKIIIDRAGNIIVTGYSKSSVFPVSEDYATIKYDPAGTQQWGARYNGTGNNEDKAFGIAVDDNDNVYVTGSGKSSMLAGSEDYSTVKYNSSGVLKWAVSYNGPGNNSDIPSAIKTDRHGNVIVTGTSRSGTDPASEDYATVKYDSSGNQKWASRYNGTGNNEDKAFGIAVDDNDNSYITGSSRSTQNSGSEDYATVKYDSTGTQKWAARYNGTGNNEDKAFGIAVDDNDNVYVTGSSRTTQDSGSEDYATVKYDSTGSQQWVTRYNGSGNNEDKAFGIAVDDNDNVIITGSSRNGTVLASDDYTTVKYSQPTGIKIISGNLPSKFNLYQNYPNPFNPSTQIRIDIPAASFVNAAIYNMLGQKVAEPVNSNLNPGTYEINWNASALPSGIYFYKITAYSTSGNTFTNTLKMTLVK